MALQVERTVSEVDRIGLAAMVSEVERIWEGAMAVEVEMVARAMEMAVEVALGGVEMVAVAMEMVVEVALGGVEMVAVAMEMAVEVATVMQDVAGTLRSKLQRSTQASPPLQRCPANLVRCRATLGMLTLLVLQLIPPCSERENSLCKSGYPSASAKSDKCKIFLKGKYDGPSCTSHTLPMRGFLLKSACST